MLLLSSQKVDPSCPGLYTTAHPQLTDSVRPTVGAGTCIPFPNWPEPDMGLRAAAEGAAAEPVQSPICPGGLVPVPCNASDTCNTTVAPCGAGNSLGCVNKVCPGAIMFNNLVMASDTTCGRLLYDRSNGMPLPGGCKEAGRRLRTQAGRLRLTSDAASTARAQNTDPKARPVLEVRVVVNVVWHLAHIRCALPALCMCSLMTGSCRGSKKLPTCALASGIM